MTLECRRHLAAERDHLVATRAREQTHFTVPVDVERPALSILGNFLDDYVGIDAAEPKRVDTRTARLSRIAVDPRSRFRVDVEG